MRAKAPFPDEHRSFYQDRFGTSTRKTHKIPAAFFWFRRRITHSMPVVHCGNLELGCPDSHAEVNASVAICIEAGGDCVLSLDLSPYGPASRNII